MSDQEKTYLELLIATEQKSQESYDKTVLALSGTAFGLTLTFMKDIIGSKPIIHSWLLLSGWGLWIFSVAFVLISFYSSHQAMLKAADAYRNDPKGYVYQKAGGLSDIVTRCLNVLSGTFCVLGMLCITGFVFNNLGGASDDKTMGKETSSKEASSKETSGKETSGKKEAGS